MTHSDWNEALEAAAAQIDCGGKGRCPERRMKDNSCLREVTGGDCPHEQAEEIRALKRPAEPRQEGWQPIETAPKDGTMVLLFPGYVFAYWDFGAEWWLVGVKPRADIGANVFREIYVDEPLTHWMPLPAAPKSPAPNHAGENAKEGK